MMYQPVEFEMFEDVSIRTHHLCHNKGNNMQENGKFHSCYHHHARSQTEHRLHLIKLWILIRTTVSEDVHTWIQSSISLGLIENVCVFNAMNEIVMMNKSIACVVQTVM